MLVFLSMSSKRDYSGKMGFSEFKELYQVIGQWQVRPLLLFF